MNMLVLLLYIMELLCLRNGLVDVTGGGVVILRNSRIKLKWSVKFIVCALKANYSVSKTIIFTC